MIVTPLFGLGKKDPFSDAYSNQKRILADSIYVRSISWYYQLSEYTIRYIQGKDQTIDLMHGETYNYYPNGKIKSVIDKTGKKLYTYTEDGKFLSSETYSFETQKCIYKTLCYYTNTGVDSMVEYWYNAAFDKFLPNNKTVVEYNSKGYNQLWYYYSIDKGDYIRPTKTIFEFDEYDRLLAMYNYQQNVDNSDFSLYSIDKNSYSNTENGIKVESLAWLTYYISIYGDHPQYKTETYYDKDGYEIKKASYNWKFEDEYWELSSSDEKTYYYSNKVANEKVTIPEFHIYSSSNKLVIDNDKEKTPIVSIYSMTGKLIIKKNINLGLNYIPLEKGLYIIEIDGKTKKVRVN